MSPLFKGGSAFLSFPFLKIGLRGDRKFLVFKADTQKGVIKNKGGQTPSQTNSFLHLGGSRNHICKLKREDVPKKRDHTPL